MNRILFAEDNDDLREMTTRLLKYEGYDVTAVADGTAALDELGRAVFDLALLDAAMPIMTGLDVAGAIRARNLSMPILIYTAYSEPIMTPLAKRYDATIINKDKGPVELLAAIKERLE